MFGLNKEQLLLTKQTKHENYLVIDKIYSGRKARILYSGKTKTAQSGIPLDNDQTMLFGYNQRFIEIIKKLKPSRILIIGGGVYTLPTAILSLDNGIAIDVVEPDDELDQVAADYFNFKPDKKLKIYHQDGMSFLKNNKKEYQLIIVDAYFDDQIPRDLLTEELPILAKKSLTKNGVVAMNTICPLRPDSAIMVCQANFSHVFSNISIYPADSQAVDYYYDQNLILVATNTEIDLELKYQPVAASA